VHAVADYTPDAAVRGVGRIAPVGARGVRRVVIATGAGALDEAT